MGVLSVTNRKVLGGKDVPAGRIAREGALQSGPYGQGFYPSTNRKVPGGKDAPAGGAGPAPTGEGIFAAIAGQGALRSGFCERGGTKIPYGEWFRDRFFDARKRPPEQRRRAFSTAY